MLALLVLLSTVSWTVDKHICMGRVMDVAFFAPAEDCCMDTAIALFGETKYNCCDDESFTLEGQDDLKLTIKDLDLGDQLVLFAFLHSFKDLYSELKQRPVSNSAYPPPLLAQDLNILYQVYLI